MRNYRFLSLSIGLVVPFIAPLSAAQAAFEAGVSAVDITPVFEGRPQKPGQPLYKWGDPFFDTNGDGQYQFLYIAGFDPFYPKNTQLDNRFATGVHDPIWARAIALREEGSAANTLVMISVDSPGILWKILNPVRRQISKDFGIPVANIHISATHSHYAPDPGGFWWALEDASGQGYIPQLQEGMYRSAAQAIKGLTPASMKAVTTTHNSCFNPKTKEIKRGADCHIPLVRRGPQISPRFEGDPDEFLIQADKRDPIIRNTRIVAAQFISKTDGRTIASIINYHNHPDSLLGDVMEVSSDYPHYLRQYLEAKLGGTAVFFNGTVGCQIHSHAGVAAPLWSAEMKPVFEADGIHRVLVKDNTWDRIRSIGYELGYEAVKALTEETLTQDSPAIKIKTEPLDVPVDNWLHVNLTKPAWVEHVDSQDQLKHYPERCDNELGCTRSDLGLIQVGDLTLLTVPGELDPSYFVGRVESQVDYGPKWGKATFPAMPALDTAMPGKHHALIGLTNNFMAYFVPLSDNVGWDNTEHPNYYEEQVTVSKDAGDDLGNKLMQMLGSPVRYSNRKIYPEGI